MSSNGNGPRPARKSATEYVRVPVEWFDKPVLQASAFHLLTGRKGVCKGTYLAGLSARITTGRVGPKPQRVLMLTSEDSATIDFLPRFDLADGDSSMLDMIEGQFKLPDDIGWLAEQAREVGGVGLIAIDPLSNHIGGADTNAEGAVRNAIASLNALADELSCIVMGVRHLGKNNDRGASNSVLGSVAWTATPRCVLVLAADDEDDMLFHLQVVEGNRAAKNSGARLLRLEVHQPYPGHPDSDVTRVVDIGESGKNVDDLLSNGEGKDSTSKSATAWALILSILDTEGEQESDTLDARVTAEVGFKNGRSVRNVRAKLKNAGLIRMVPPIRDALGEYAEGGKWFVRRTNAPDAKPTLTPSLTPEGRAPDSLDNL